MRQFDKPAISVADQVDLLKARGLKVPDDSAAIDLLKAVSFFRLTPYMRPFQIEGDALHRFRPSTKLDALSELYDFDRRLRLLTMDAIERVEVAVRATVSNHMGPAYGSHWYMDPNIFRQHYDHTRLVSTIEKAQAKARHDFEIEVARIEQSRKASEAHKARLKERRAQESYARHYALTYSEPQLMPGWAAMEELTLGSLSHLYKDLSLDRDRKAIAKRFELPAPVLESWLHTLSFVRNICAHHGRLWNRELEIKPAKPRSASFMWPCYLESAPQYTRVGSVFAILRHLVLRIDSDTTWASDLAGLLSAYPSVSKPQMGLPDDWLEDPFWR